MSKQNGVKLGFGIICLLIIVGCSTDTSIQGVVENYPNEEVTLQVPTTESPTVPAADLVQSATPIPPEPTKNSEEPQGSSPDEAWVSSVDAGSYVGQVVTVRVEVSQCSYKPNVNGSPTFCNDQPYPNHDFTYLMWGADLSQFDQFCVLVTGEIVEYDGKPQIVVEKEDQIRHCDG